MNKNERGLYLDFERNFYPDLFMEFLVEMFSEIATYKKPFYVLKLKGVLLAHEKTNYGILSADIDAQSDFHKILLSAFSVHGDIEEQINQCMGKQVFFELYEEQREIGIITGFIENIDLANNWGDVIGEFENLEMDEEERWICNLGQQNPGFRVKTKHGEIEIGFFGLSKAYFVEQQ